MPRCSLRRRCSARHPRHAHAPRKGRAARGSGWLRASPPLPSPPRRGLLFARSGRESRFADRTGKLGLGQCRLDHRVPLGVEGHGAHRCPVPGLAAPAARVRLTCLLIDFVPGSQQRTILAGMALCRRDVADTAIPICVLERSKVFPARAGMNRLASGAKGAVAGVPRSRGDEPLRHNGIPLLHSTIARNWAPWPSSPAEMQGSH